MTEDVMLEQLDFWLAVGVLALLAWAKCGRYFRAVWAWAWRGFVNDYADAASDIMSRGEDEVVRLNRPSLQTVPPQTPDQTETPAERRKKMLDICTILRRRGFSRDEARALLNLCGMPLDNNIWAQVPPLPEPEYTTPIAGRPTAAQFETDPELSYQPPPR